MTQQSTRWGEDTDNAWNDRHFQHCWFWLTMNLNSPFYGAPAMLLAALKIPYEQRSGFRAAFRKAHFDNYRFSVRLRLTSGLKRVLAGEYEATVTKRNKNGLAIGYDIRAAADPKPLACPPFYRGSVNVTSKGLKLFLRATQHTMQSNYNPEGRARLLNPFSKA